MEDSDSSSTSSSEPEPDPEPDSIYDLDCLTDICIMCRNHIYDQCSSCVEKPTGVPTVRCDVVYGACKHVFHVHCLVPWLKIARTCPLDDLPWKFKE